MSKIIANQFQAFLTVSLSLWFYLVAGTWLWFFYIESARVHVIAAMVSIIAFSALFIVYGRIVYLSQREKFFSIALYMWMHCVFVIILMFSFTYREFGIIDSDGNITRDFFDSLYFSIENFTGLGYDEFRPSIESRFFAIGEAVLGYICFGVLVGIAISILQRDNKI